MFECIGNTNRITCPICVKLVKAGSNKSFTELDHYPEMHKEYPGFHQKCVGLPVCCIKKF